MATSIQACEPAYYTLKERKITVPALTYAIYGSDERKYRVRHILYGTTLPTVDEMYKIATFLGTSIETSFRVKTRNAALARAAKSA